MAVESLGISHALVRQFIWREFYCVLIYYHPRLVQGQLNAYRTAKDKTRPKLNAPFQTKFDKFKWKWSSKHYELFKQGQTGVPLVDAAVRCLNATGWCHNRARLVAGSYLVKILGVDWREGERWYATVAVDYDVANNSGGWLWVSGQGADAQPFFRVFNPYRQSQKFDPECEFIYKWVPELRNVPPHIIHHWDEYSAKQNRKLHAESNKRVKMIVKASKDTQTKDTKHADKKASQDMKKAVDAPYTSQYKSPIMEIKDGRRTTLDRFRKFIYKKERDY